MYHYHKLACHGPHGHGHGHGLKRARDDVPMPNALYETAIAALTNLLQTPTDTTHAGQDTIGQLTALIPLLARDRQAAQVAQATQAAQAAQARQEKLKAARQAAQARQLAAQESAKVIHTAEKFDMTAVQVGWGDGVTPTDGRITATPDVFGEYSVDNTVKLSKSTGYFLENAPTLQSALKSAQARVTDIMVPTVEGPMTLDKLLLTAYGAKAVPTHATMKACGLICVDDGVAPMEVYLHQHVYSHHTTVTFLFTSFTSFGPWGYRIGSGNIGVCKSEDSVSLWRHATGNIGVCKSEDLVGATGIPLNAVLLQRKADDPPGASGASGGGARPDEMLLITVFVEKNQEEKLLPSYASMLDGAGAFAPAPDAPVYRSLGAAKATVSEQVVAKTTTDVHDIMKGKTVLAINVKRMYCMTVDTATKSPAGGTLEDKVKHVCQTLNDETLISHDFDNPLQPHHMQAVAGLSKKLE